MKNKFKYITLAVLAGSLASCADLDTEYLGGYVSAEQKVQANNMNANLSAAGVVGIFSSMYPVQGVYSFHGDFGYPAIMLGLDLQTADMNSNWSGYNWMRYWQGFSSPTSTGTPAGMCWYHMYKLIKSENDLLASLPKDSTDPQTMFYRAQGLASRSFCYWVLAQTFAHNVQRHPADLCVPILTDENAEQAAIEGAPRATTTEVYAQIMSDINEAVDLLSATTFTPEQAVSDRPKRLISKATAFGLRARYNLTQGKYAEAANDAQAAITNFSGRPYSISELQRPGFASLSEPSWMWGLAVSITDDPVMSGIINFPSFMCSFTGNGYSNYGAWKAMAQDLWRSIPETDVRKGQFLNEQYTSPNINAAEQAFLDQYLGPIPTAGGNANIVYPYTNVKFSAYKGELLNADNCQDIVYMRVEEMYYILAEAQAMTSPATGKATLEDFVKTYRNPSYTCAATTSEAIQEEVFQQKRMELWGEGLIYYDYMRLGKGVDRRYALAPDACCYNIPAEDPVLIYLLPDDEMNNNKGMKDQKNNPEASKPNPVASLADKSFSPQ